MFLRRLDLVGFKSFAPRTSTELLPGISVVVGPNGSGKSNVADAVRWVLGEQSAKAVRARKPEEVIFAGSASRQPLGMAEVSLIFDNSEASLPIEYAEVRVTRRLYRSGESEYLLNGSRVRLRDITQLLLHAGVSADGYAVIGQGSVDELILQRPDERRVAFENAADIRRHQLRLHETRTKLAATTANLTRVQDVLAELGPHVRRLKTQADRASRAESFRGELRGLLVRWFRERLVQATAEQQTASDELAQATAAAQHAEAATQAAEQSLAGLDAALAGLDEELAGLRPRAAGLRDQARTAERALAVVRERAAGLASLHSQAVAERQQLAERVEQLVAEETEAAAIIAPPAPPPPPATAQDDTRQGDAAGEEPVLGAAAGETADVAAAAGEWPELAAARARVAAIEAVLDELQRERATLQRARDAAQADADRAASRLSQTNDQLRTLEANVAVEEARRADRAGRLRALDAQVAELEQERQRTAERVAQARTALAEATERRRAAAGRVEQTTAALAATRQQRDRLHGALTALGLPEAPPATDADRAGAQVAAASGGPGAPGADVRVAAKAGGPAALGAVLDGLAVLGTLGELAARVRPLDRVVRGYLTRTLVLGDDAAAREAFRRLVQALPADAPAWAVVSLDGLFLAPGGERGLEATDGPQVLRDWRRQLAELEAELGAAQAQGAEQEAALQAARAGLASREADERAARSALSEHEARATQLERSLRGLAHERQQLDAEQTRSARQAERQAALRLTESERAAALRQTLEQAQAEAAAQAATLQAAEARLAELLAAAGDTRAELAGLESAVLQRQAQHEARVALHARVRAELEAARGAVEAAGRRIEQLVGQATELAEREQTLVREIEAALGPLAPVEERLAVAEQQRAGLGAQRRSHEQQLGQLRTDERAAHGVREERHVAAQRASDELERLHTELAETAELEGEQSLVEQLRLDLPSELAPETAAVDLEAMRRRINTLQRELRAVGGVADSVVAEYHELRERHDFLEHQSDDLRQAMAELQKAAAELEEHMRERFSAVFQAVEEAFVECFKVLFGGGDARLVLTEPDDLLGSGIDIVARPPGKKLQGLLSLSGGERALTIVALLFGLLKVNPTPFCVLDEVDAALDEANVQRFANLLAEFAQRIQFIVVTHNRATMEKADALYGVSMDADGISRILTLQPRAVAAAGTSG